MRFWALILVFLSGLGLGAFIVYPFIKKSEAYKKYKERRRQRREEKWRDKPPSAVS